MNKDNFLFFGQNFDKPKIVSQASQAAMYCTHGTAK